MRSEVLTCDECGKKEENQTVPATYGGGVPFKHWVQGVDRVLDFCCAKCAGNYFTKLGEEPTH